MSTFLYSCLTRKEELGRIFCSLLNKSLVLVIFPSIYLKMIGKFSLLSKSTCGCFFGETCLTKFYLKYMDVWQDFSIIQEKDYFLVLLNLISVKVHFSLKYPHCTKNEIYIKDFFCGFGHIYWRNPWSKTFVQSYSRIFLKSLLKSVLMY